MTELENDRIENTRMMQEKRNNFVKFENVIVQIPLILKFSIWVHPQKN